VKARIQNTSVRRKTFLTGLTGFTGFVSGTRGKSGLGFGLGLVHGINQRSSAELSVMAFQVLGKLLDKQGGVLYISKHVE
jgi:hypothetical protein